jgi:hypothetical protein
MPIGVFIARRRLISVAGHDASRVRVNPGFEGESVVSSTTVLWELIHSSALSVAASPCCVRLLEKENSEKYARPKGVG